MSSAAAALSVGCTAPDAPVRDDAGAAPPLCGNGVIDRDSEGRPEGCDDGDLNGSNASLCTKQCVPGSAALGDEREIRIGDDITYAVQVRFVGSNNYGVAATTGVEGQIFLLRSIGAEPLAQYSPEITKIDRPGKVLALGSIATPTSGSLLPIWVERLEDRSLELHVADWMGDQPTIYDYAYPFAEGSIDVRLSSPRHDSAITIVDLGEDSQLRVASLSLEAGGALRMVKSNVPSAGLQLGKSIETYQVDARSPVHFSHEIVQFFSDTGKFIALEVQDHISIIEISRGYWPTKVIEGKPWYGLLPFEPEIRWPTPFAILDDVGQVWLWQFSRQPSAEELVTPFTTVSVGTTALYTFHQSVAHVLSFDPAGYEVVASEGDAGNLRASSLALQIRPAGKVASRYLVLDGFDDGDIGYIADGSMFVWQ